MKKGYTVDHEYDNHGFEANDVSSQGSRDLDTSTSENPHDDLRCGYGGCKPACLQICNNPKAMLVWMSWFAFIQGFVVNGINNVNTASVERRFELSSSQVSLISSAYDISAGIFVLPITYYATYAHQPRLLAFSALVMSVGSFIMAVPHFATGLYQLQESTADYCDVHGNATVRSSDDDGSSLRRYLGVLILGQFLHGIGGTTLYSVGIVFIDTSVSAKSSPLYQGIFYAFSTLGPAIGYLLGGYFLTYYVDVDELSADKITIDSSDPRWVGAWWIGFLLAGALAISIVLVLLPYPRELPQAGKVREERVSEAHNDGTESIASKQGFGKSIKDLPTSLKFLLINPVNMLITFAGVAESFSTAGIATFLPKIIQSQFNQTQSDSAFMSGALAVPGSALGMFLGGLISRLLKLKIRGNIMLATTVSCISICASFALILRCNSENEAGITTLYPNSSLPTLSRINLTSGCNADCNCNVQSYEPMCSDAGLQYFSPCHAGCPPGAKSKDENDSVTTFTNCSCVNYEMKDNLSVINGTNGRCGRNSCNNLYIFLVVVFVAILTTFMQSVPGIAVALRCIPENQRSFGMGVRWVFMRFLGGVLGPIGYGTLIDGACQVWQYPDAKGSCWIYDNESFSYRMVAMTVAIKAFGLICFLVAYFCYKPPLNEKETAMVTSSNSLALIDNGTAATGFSNPSLTNDSSVAT